MKFSKLLPIATVASLAFFSSFTIVAAQTDTNIQVSSSDTQQKEAKALNILMIVDMGEIKAAKMALVKTTNPNVKNFAQRMIKDHSQNLKLAKQFGQTNKIKPMNSDKAQELMKQGKDEAAILNDKKGKDFDVAYIDAMVKGHEGALKMIDNVLLPNANNPQEKNLLNTTRATVMEHLKLAEDVKAKL